MIYRGRKGGAHRKKEKGGFSTRERGTSVNYYRRVGRTMKARFIPGNATDRCHVIATLEKRLRGKRRPVSKPSTACSRFNRIVIKLSSIRTNVRASVYEKARVPAEENRKCHSSFVCSFEKALTALLPPLRIREKKFSEGNLHEETKVSLLYALQLVLYKKYYQINYAKMNLHWLFTFTDT